MLPPLTPIASARQGKFSCQEDRQITGRQADRRDLPGSQPNLANKFQCEGLVALLGVEVVELVQPNLLYEHGCRKVARDGER